MTTKEKIYSKKDTDNYIANGHYKIDGVEYMSVWTFKRMNRIKNNVPKQNQLDSTALRKSGVPKMMVVPDEIKTEKQINVYPIMILKLYFNV